jgi:cation channel sperm-associated protein 2
MSSRQQSGREPSSSRNLRSTSSLGRPPPVLTDGERTLSTHSLFFRSALIQEFRIADDFTIAADANAPKLTTRDLSLDPNAFKSLLRDNPHQLIGFHHFKRTGQSKRPTDVRLRRIRNIYRLPIGVWARWVVDHPVFQTFMTLVVILNAAIIGVQAELQEDTHYSLLRVLDYADTVFLLLYVIEILLKFLDSFTGFWRDPWNVFDFAITFASLPEFALSFVQDSGLQAQLDVAGVGDLLTSIRLLRTLRALRAVGRFRSLRVIMATIVSAFSSLFYIVILLLLVMYIFAIFGIGFFYAYVHSERSDLVFQHRWSSLGSAMLTLFQLMTFDHWYAQLQDVMEVVSSGVAITYFMSWIWLGAFIFRNVFVGVMVERFQNLKKVLQRQADERRRERHLAKVQRSLARKLAKRNKEEMQQMRQRAADAERDLRELERQQAIEAVLTAAPDDVVDTAGAGDVLQPETGTTATTAQQVLTDQLTLLANRAARRDQSRDVFWPRDTLFTYFRALDGLQECLAEYQQLQVLFARSVTHLLK